VAEAGSSFAGFSGGSGSAVSCSGTANCTFTLSADSSLSATFNVAVAAKDKLTITKAGAGAGKVECQVGTGAFEACASEYPEASKLTLKGVAEAGSSFAGFSGGSGSAVSCSGTANCTFTLSADSSLSATFNGKPWQFVGEVTPIGSNGVLSFTQEVSTPPRGGPGTLMVRGSAAVSRGKARLRLSCSAAGPCDGKLTLTINAMHGRKARAIVAGQAFVQIAAAQQQTIKFQLSKAALRVLRHTSGVAAKLTGPGFDHSVKLKRTPSG
jgi:hypothetical protein